MYVRSKTSMLKVEVKTDLGEILTLYVTVQNFIYMEP